MNSYEEKPRETNRLDNQTRPPASMPQMPPEPEPIPWRLLIQISGNSHTTIGIEIKERILIGRDADVDLDLTTFGGAERGVSRRHAAIIRMAEHLYVQDLNSTNGTRLNGLQAVSEHVYRLRDGDELELGTVRLVIRFLKSPF
jgi:pSer/pThr/pTyr-binding forkhead associated (FHA) protein